MVRASLIVSFVAAAAAAASGATKQRGWRTRTGAAPPPVASFEPLRYIGRWYQVYGDLSGEFYESRYCVVADYGVFANGTVSVRNRERASSVTGAETDILGWAAVNFTSLNTANGALVVNLHGVPVPAPYDIILLGPKTYGQFGSYQYAVVSDQLEISLFVLARDVNEFYAKYNQTVYDELEALGYDTWLNDPIQTFQDGCPVYTELDLSNCNSENGR